MSIYNMKHFIIRLIIIIGASVTITNAQERHENHFDIAPFENSDLRIEFDDVEAQQKFAAAKMNIHNKTNDFFFVKGRKSTFKLPQKNYETTTGKNQTIPPNDTTRISIKAASDDKKMHVKSFKIDLQGFFRAKPQEKVFPMSDVQLTLKKNKIDLSATPFKIEIVDYDDSEEFYIVKFVVEYTGEKIAIIDCSLIELKAQDGRILHNISSKIKREIMESYDRDSYMLKFNRPDMKKYTEPCTLIWNNSFSESHLEPVEMGTVDAVFSPEETRTIRKY